MNQSIQRKLSNVQDVDAKHEGEIKRAEAERDDAIMQLNTVRVEFAEVKDKLQSVEKAAAAASDTAAKENVSAKGAGDKAQAELKELKGQHKVLKGKVKDLVAEFKKQKERLEEAEGAATANKASTADVTTSRPLF